MPHRAAEICAEVDPGQNDFDVVPVVYTKGHAIGRRAIHAIRLVLALEAGDGSPAVRQRTRGRDGMAHRRLLDIGRHNAHIPKTRGNIRKCGEAGAIDAIVVGNQDSHAQAPRPPRTSLVPACLCQHSMDVVLLHNAKAGDESWSRSELVKLIRRAGFEPRYYSLKRALDEP